MAKLKEIFAKNKNIIINADLDGILSGAILQKYYGCKIVGFSNSVDKLWLTSRIKDIYKPIYIDMYVNKPEVICIDQHMISFGKKHHAKIKKYKTKINPNLERNRTFLGDMKGGYKQKYPFGTIHYLMFLMAKEGIQIELPDLNHKCTNENKCCTIGNLILRADNALYSTFQYEENAKDWWKWLEKSKSNAISLLKEYANKNKEDAETYRNIASDFLKSYGCSRGDGMYYDITDEDGNLYSSARIYIKSIAKMIGIQLRIPRKYIIYMGKFGKRRIDEETNIDVLLKDELYSYAFTYGPNSINENFSYTEKMV